MKIHRYRIRVYEGLHERVCGHGQIQNRVYIPRQAVIGYCDIEKMDFFSEKEKHFSEAEKIIWGIFNFDNYGEAEYFGEFDLSRDCVSTLISSGRLFNKVRDLFNETGKIVLGSL